MENTIFFTAAPRPYPEDVLIAEVSVSQVNESNAVEGATAQVKIVRIEQTPPAPVRPGDMIPMKYRVSSCGPKVQEGATGIIVAKTGWDSRGQRVLYPYTRRHDDTRMMAPPLRE